MENCNFGYFSGTHAKRILVLGESHHWSPEDKEKTQEEREELEQGYRTERVINDYLQMYQKCKRCNSYEFFEKIVRSFGFDVNDRTMFWDSVYFKNYISDHLCGVANNVAKKITGENRSKYNDELFSFINEKGITAVFVFGRLVYDSLPSYGSEEERCKNCDNGTLTVKGKRDHVSHCIYLSGIRHDHTDVLLDHHVEVFGMRHPSARSGFCPENYSGILDRAYKANLEP